VWSHEREAGAWNDMPCNTSALGYTAHCLCGGPANASSSFGDELEVLEDRPQACQSTSRMPIDQYRETAGGRVDTYYWHLDHCESCYPLVAWGAQWNQIALECERVSAASLFNPAEPGVYDPGRYAPAIRECIQRCAADQPPESHVLFFVLWHIAVALLPTVVALPCLVRACRHIHVERRNQRRLVREAAEGHGKAEQREPTRRIVPGDTYSGSATDMHGGKAKQRLQAIQQAAASRRFFTSLASFQLGFFLCVLGLGPLFAFGIGNMMIKVLSAGMEGTHWSTHMLALLPVVPEVGSYINFLPFAPPGFALMITSLLPTDRRLICFVTWLLFLFASAVVALFLILLAQILPYLNVMYPRNG